MRKITEKGIYMSQNQTVFLAIPNLKIIGVLVPKPPVPYKKNILIFLK